MSRYPDTGPYGRPDPYQQPGSIPLRPLAVGEILGLGWGVVRRNLGPLAGAAAAVSAVSSVVTVGALAATGSLQTFADAGWVDDLLRGGSSTTIPPGIVIATLLGLLVSTIGGPIVAGLAVAFAGAEAMGRDGRGAVTERLAGRWPVLLATAAVVGVLVAAGLLVLVVPGVFAYLILAFAGPAVVMERGSIGESLRRSAALTRGHRARILGAVAVTMIAGTVAATVISSFAGAVVGGTGSVTTLLVTQAVSVLVGGLAGAWTGSVIALLYIDVRVRTEHLDDALRAAAAADRSRVIRQDPPAA